MGGRGQSNGAEMKTSGSELPDSEGLSERPGTNWLSGVGLVGVLALLIVGMLFFNSCQQDAKEEAFRAAVAEKVKAEAAAKAAANTLTLQGLMANEAARVATEAARSAALTANQEPKKSKDSALTQIPAAEPGFVAPTEPAHQPPSQEQPSDEEPPHEEPPHEEPPDEEEQSDSDGHGD